MNYKKLLKQTLLSIGTVVTASNTVLAILLLEEDPQFLNARRAIVRGQNHIALWQLIQAGDPNPQQTIQNFMLNNVFNHFFLHRKQGGAMVLFPQRT